MKKITPEHVGKILLIEFYDHALAEMAILCRCVGFVEKMNEEFVVLTWWDVLNCDQDSRDANRESVTIVKSAITKFKVLR